MYTQIPMDREVDYCDGKKYNVGVQVTKREIKREVE